MLNLSNTDIVKDGRLISSCNHLGDDVKEVAFPHGVEVGEDRVLDPQAPA